MNSCTQLRPARLRDEPVATLANLERHACLAQISEPEERAGDELSAARIIYVSSDGARHWREVDRSHPSLRARSYTIAGADDASRRGCKWDFGVGVRDHAQPVARRLEAASHEG